MIQMNEAAIEYMHRVGFRDIVLEIDGSRT